MVTLIIIVSIALIVLYVLNSKKAKEIEACRALYDAHGGVAKYQQRIDEANERYDALGDPYAHSHTFKIDEGDDK